MVEIVLIGPSCGGKTAMGKKLRDEGFTGPIWEQHGQAENPALIVVHPYTQHLPLTLVGEAVRAENTRIDVLVTPARTATKIQATVRGSFAQRRAQSTRIAMARILLAGGGRGQINRRASHLFYQITGVLLHTHKKPDGTWRGYCGIRALCLEDPFPTESDALAALLRKAIQYTEEQESTMAECELRQVLSGLFKELTRALQENPRLHSLSVVDKNEEGYRMLFRVARPEASIRSAVPLLRAHLEWEEARKASSQRLRLYLHCRVGKISRPVLNLLCTAGGAWHGQVAEPQGPHLTGTKAEVLAWAEAQLQQMELADKLPPLPESDT